METWSELDFFLYRSLFDKCLKKKTILYIQCSIARSTRRFINITNFTVYFFFKVDVYLYVPLQAREWVKANNNLLRVDGAWQPRKAVRLAEGKLWFETSAVLWSYPNTEKAMEANPNRGSGVETLRWLVVNTDNIPATPAAKSTPCPVYF